MRIIVNRKLAIVGGILLLLGIIFYLGKVIDAKVQNSWDNEASWEFSSISLSEKIEPNAKLEWSGKDVSITIPTCTLYKIDTDTDGNKFYSCSLYPTRYFTHLTWLISSDLLKPDVVIAVEKNYLKDFGLEEDQKLPVSVTLTIKATQQGYGLQALEKFRHYVITSKGAVDTRDITLTSFTIAKATPLTVTSYLEKLFPESTLAELKTEQGAATTQSLLNIFQKDASNSDKTPHFTEGLVFGLYLLSRKDEKSVQDILVEISKNLIPFRSPIITERETDPSITLQSKGLVLAPHTKFPLCPIVEVLNKQWTSTPVSIFMAYQKYQPAITIAASETAPLKNIYDADGNLLEYDNMIHLDAYCQSVIEKKNIAGLSRLQAWYQQYVYQYFVYSSDSEIGTQVIDGQDSLRGYVLRGILKNPNDIKNNEKVLQDSKKSLFDGILWTYIYGKN